VEYEPLEVVADAEAALAADAPLVHDEAGTNLLVTREFARGSILTRHRPPISSSRNALGFTATPSSRSSHGDAWPSTIPAPAS
jgi:CO/xanthine dehydrogenase Mo-binding subunit